MALNSADCVPIILIDVSAVTPEFVMVFPLRSTESELASQSAASSVAVIIFVDPFITTEELIVTDIMFRLC